MNSSKPTTMTLADTALRGRGAGTFYVEEPDIPVGMTCTEWRRRRQPLAKLWLLSHLRAWLRWHQLRQALS